MRFLALFLFPLFLFADVASEKDTLADSLFTADDAIVAPGACSFSCRAVADGYITQIIDIDAKSGTTHCEVYSRNDTSKALGVNANQQNLTCKAQANKNPGDYTGQLKSNSDTNYQLSGAKYSTDSMTFSRFLTGMATLDPDIIDFSATNSTGILQVKSPSMLYGTNISTSRQETFLSFFGVEDATTSSEIVSSVDSLNKANLGYFSNLFSNMSTIYSYLQNLLFVFVSGFFVLLIGTKKIQAYLAKEKENDQVNYLTKLYIPVIAVAFFYIPMPSENNMRSSLMQAIIRNFMATGTQVADKAAVIGANTYLQKLYASVGANTMKGEATIYSLRDSAKAQRDLYANVMQQCKTRFPDAMTFQVKDAELDQQSIYNFNKVQEGITAKACRSIERRWLIASRTFDQQSKYADQIAQSFSNNALQSKLNSINTLLNNRQNELGWINAAFMPSAAILIEMMPLVEVAKSTIVEDQEDNQKKIRDAYASGDEEKSLFEKIKTTGGSIFGAVMAKMAYMILPGVDSVFQVFNAIIGSGVEMITFIATFFSPLGEKAFSFISKGGGGATTQLASLVLAAMFVGLILKYIPLITSMIAGILAVVGWLFELTQYFFITPFVVAYAVTMRKTDKISEYLVTGIVIFFKPVLLVIFIYLGLFLYYLSIDVFLQFAEEQFYLLDAINQSFFVAMVLQLSLGLIKITSSFAAVYLMWKVILSAPGHVIKMIGLHNVGDFLEPISNKLERPSLV
ncbi:MAG: hypothetical protein PHR87_03640 [Sulfurospirillaceae bacterium]|nr:hypothetical protein [Sulfurospirillaceae bacterium]